MPGYGVELSAVSDGSHQRLPRWIQTDKNLDFRKVPVALGPEWAGVKRN